MGRSAWESLSVAVSCHGTLQALEAWGESHHIGTKMQVSGHLFAAYTSPRTYFPPSSLEEFGVEPAAKSRAWRGNKPHLSIYSSQTITGAWSSSKRESKEPILTLLPLVAEGRISEFHPQDLAGFGIRPSRTGGRQ